MMTCGGVDIAINVDQDDFEKSTKDKAILADLKQKIFSSRRNDRVSVNWKVDHHNSITRFVIDESVKSDIENLLLEIKKADGKNAANVDYFFSSADGDVSILHLLDNTENSFFKATIYDALQSFKMETNSISFAVVGKNNRTYAIYSDKSAGGSVYKFQMHVSGFIDYSKARFISGVPKEKVQFEAIGTLNSTFEEWKKIHGALEKSVDVLKPLPNMGKGIKLETGTLENFQKFLGDKQVETLFIIAHHENGQMYFFDDNNNKQIITSDHIKNWHAKGLIKTKQIILISCRTGGRTTILPEKESTITEAFIDAGVNHVLAPTENIDALDSIDFLNRFINQTSRKINPKRRLVEIIKEELSRLNRINLDRPLVLDHWVKFYRLKWDLNA
jgi:hypothetical protein